MKVCWYYQHKQLQCPECGEGLRCCHDCDQKSCPRCIRDYCPACMAVKVVDHAFCNCPGYGEQLRSGLCEGTVKMSQPQESKMKIKNDPKCPTGILYGVNPRHLKSSGNPTIAYVEDCYLTRKRTKSCECNRQPCSIHDKDYDVIMALLDAYHQLWNLYVLSHQKERTR